MEAAVNQFIRLPDYLSGRGLFAAAFLSHPVLLPGKARPPGQASGNYRLYRCRRANRAYSGGHGCVIIDLSPRNHRIFRNRKPLTPPIYALFFAIAGTELTPAVFAKRRIPALGLVFIPARGLGKIGGVRCGALIAKSRANIRRYLGFRMLPQAGVAIGLVLTIQAPPPAPAIRVFLYY